MKSASAKDQNRLLDPDLPLRRERITMRKMSPTKILKPLPAKEYAFSAEKMLIPKPHFFINGTKPRAENPSARMTRLRFIENVCKRFFIADWEDGFVLKQVLCLP